MLRPTQSQDLNELRPLADIAIFQQRKLVLDQLIVHDLAEIVKEVCVVAESLVELLGNLETFTQAHLALFSNKAIHAGASFLVVDVFSIVSLVPQVPTELL